MPRDEGLAPRHHVFRTIEMTGGFLLGLRLPLAPGFNCIIGGRGTGKSTVIELVRHVLGLRRIAEDDDTPKARERLASLIEHGVAEGVVRLQISTRHGIDYRAERGAEDAARVFNAKDEAIALSFDRGDVFTADVYSQNEIEEIARDPGRQLQLLDRFIEQDVAAFDAEIRRIQRELAVNAGDIVKIEREMNELRVTASKRTEVEEALKGLPPPTGPDATLLEAANQAKALREKERRSVEVLRRDVGEIRNEMTSTASGLTRRITTRIEQDVASGANKAVFATLAAKTADVARVVERAVESVVEAVEEAERTFVEQSELLADRHAKQEASYRELLQRSKEDATASAERTKRLARHSEVMSAVTQLQLRDQDRAECDSQRRELLGKLSAARNARFKLRSANAERLSRELDPDIRITILEAGDRSEYEGVLSDALKGKGVRHQAVAKALGDSVTPRELVSLVHKSDATQISERSKLGVERSEKVIEALGDPALLCRIEAVDLGDKPLIELRDGKKFKESEKLSTGQRCTAILPILLLESERPLLIDQPEDNLDNSFIFEAVVKRLKAIKGRRQLVFVTHNPNILVLGEADRVFVMESDGESARLRSSGSVDEVKDEIERILEGGKKAFQLRKERYGY